MPIKRIIAYSLIMLSIAIVVWRRVAGIDLTEGQLFVQDWQYWVTALMLGGIGIGLMRIR